MTVYRALRYGINLQHAFLPDVDDKVANLRSQVRIPAGLAISILKIKIPLRRMRSAYSFDLFFLHLLRFPQRPARLGASGECRKSKGSWLDGHVS